MNTYLIKEIEVNVDTYEWQKKLKVNHQGGKYIISTPRGVMVLNTFQYKILTCFNGIPKTLREVIDQHSNYNAQSIYKLLDVLIYEKILVNTKDNVLQRKTIGYYWRLITKFPLPKRFLVYMIEKLFVKTNLKLMSVMSLILLLMAIYSNVVLIQYTEFSWYNTPRIFAFFIMGFFVAVYHEMWLGYFIIKHGGSITDFKLRVILGVFATLAINWQYLLLLEKKEKIKVFIYTNLFTSTICGIFSVIGYVFMTLGHQSMARYFCTFSIVGFSYMGINLWPFLFKGDGYNLYCFITDTSRLKNHFFKVIFYKLTARDYYLVKTEKRKYYYLYGTLFIMSLIFLQIAIVKGFRLRI